MPTLTYCHLSEGFALPSESLSLSIARVNDLLALNVVPSAHHFWAFDVDTVSRPASQMLCNDAPISNAFFPFSVSLLIALVYVP